MSKRWPFGTVVRINVAGLVASPPPDLPSVGAARVMVVSDTGEAGFVGIALVDTTLMTAGKRSADWIRKVWEPVDE